MRKINVDPFKFGLYGGLTFALIYTILHYIIETEFTLLGIVGGFVWFLTTIIILKHMRKESL